MMRANHGASDQPVPERMWKHAQWQVDSDEGPRIPLQTDVSEAPDVESQAALRTNKIELRNDIWSGKGTGAVHG